MTDLPPPPPSSVHPPSVAPTPDPHGPPASKGAGRWVKVALGVSVALNLGIAGLVLGAALREGGPGRGMMLRDIDAGPFTEALSREDRDALRRAFIARSPDLRDMRRSMARDARDILAALRAEPFQPEALRAALSRQGARLTERLAIGQDLLFERLATMTPEARTAFADRLEERLRRGPGRGDSERGGAERGGDGD